MRPAAALANSAWVASAWADWRHFRRALDEPAGTQAGVLQEICKRCAGTPAMPGRFEDLPPRTWEAFEPLVARAAAGETGVLTRETINRFVPTSGSSAANKLVPSTPLLRRQFNRAIHAWIFSLYARDPGLLAGPAYWSISPAVAQERTSGGIAVGFEEDSAYLGRFGKLLVDRALAVPGDVRHLPMDEFQRATALFLLAEPELRLISVWNPTFLTRLMAFVDRHRDDLLRQLRDGVVVCGRRLRRPVPAEPWPKLRLISCWTDARARTQVPALARWFPRAAIQPKGLVATEAFISLPYGDMRPLAITSHYLEFATDDGRLVRVDQLREGDEGCVVVTTGGGLVRYRLGDRVVVTGFLRRTPCVRFLGRQDAVSDLCGEKLTDAFVAAVLQDLGVSGFSMLAPDGSGYTLYAENPPDPALLEARLAANVHYRWAVALGQLAPARVFKISGDGAAAYTAACQARGQRLGEIKPVALDGRCDWGAVFSGQWVSSMAASASDHRPLPVAQAEDEHRDHGDQ